MGCGVEAPVAGVWGGVRIENLHGSPWMTHKVLMQVCTQKTGPEPPVSSLVLLVGWLPLPLVWGPALGPYLS